MSTHGSIVGWALISTSGQVEIWQSDRLDRADSSSRTFSFAFRVGRYWTVFLEELSEELVLRLEFLPSLSGEGILMWYFCNFKIFNNTYDFKSLQNQLTSGTVHTNTPPSLDPVTRNFPFGLYRADVIEVACPIPTATSVPSW